MKVVCLTVRLCPCVTGRCTTQVKGFSPLRGGVCTLRLVLLVSVILWCLMLFLRIFFFWGGLSQQRALSQTLRSEPKGGSPTRGQGQGTGQGRGTPAPDTLAEARLLIQTLDLRSYLTQYMIKTRSKPFASVSMRYCHGAPTPCQTPHDTDKYQPINR